MARHLHISADHSLSPKVKLAVFPAAGERNRVFLLPGEFHVSSGPAQITTILGSCVSICLWDSESHIGGMNHYLFPEWSEGDGSSNRFGNLSTLALVENLLVLGCEPSRMKAKLFGGAALFCSAGNYASSLGAKNVDVARRMLAHAGIEIIAQDTGGHYGRKIVFHTDDCSAWSRKV